MISTEPSIEPRTYVLSSNPLDPPLPVQNAVDSLQLFHVGGLIWIKAQNGPTSKEIRGNLLFNYYLLIFISTFTTPPPPHPSPPPFLRCRRRHRRLHRCRRRHCRRRRRQSFNSNLEMSSLNGLRLAPMSWQKNRWKKFRNEFETFLKKVIGGCQSCATNSGKIFDKKCCSALFLVFFGLFFSLASEKGFQLLRFEIQIEMIVLRRSSCCWLCSSRTSPLLCSYCHFS